MLARLERHRDFGLLVLRLGLGALLVLHGYPKLIGGPAAWRAVGGAMAYVGVRSAPALWGLLAALTESVGGLLLALGLAFRPVCLGLLAAMSVAAAMHLGRGEGVRAASHALELAFVLFGLLFVGPGRLSFDRK